VSLDADEAEVLALLDSHGPLRTGRDTDHIVSAKVVAALKRSGLVKVRRYSLDVRPDPEGPIVRASITDMGRRRLQQRLQQRDAVR
jgi:hypothetical protein